MRKTIATLLAAAILLAGCINLTLDLFGAKIGSRAAIAEELASGGESAEEPEPSNPAGTEKPSGDGGRGTQQASGPAANGAENPVEGKVDEESSNANSVEIVSESTVTSAETIDTDVTENGTEGDTPSEELTVSPEENEETEPVNDAAQAADSK